MVATKLRFILLIVGAVIILAILWDGLRRKKRKMGKYQSANSSSSKRGDDHDQIFREEILGLHDDKEPEVPLSEADAQEIALPQPAIEVEENEPFVLDEVASDAVETVQAQAQPEAIEEDIETLENDIFEEVEIEPNAAPKENIITIYVMAKGDQLFGGYELLQTILANDMHYGEMQIFHRRDPEAPATTLFSLVSATEPGDFDLSKMETFTCKGLILFMNACDHKNPESILDEMIATAEQLAKDLGGELRTHDNQPWDKTAVNL